MMTRRGRRVRLASALALIGALLALGPAAHAKLDSKAWKAAKAEYETLFKARGEAEKKVAVLKTIASDGTARAWKLLSQALPVQVARMEAIHGAYAKAANVHGDILLATLKGYSPNQEDAAKDLQRTLKALEADASAERQVYDALLQILTEGPANARKPVLRLAKPKAEPALRAAVATVAGRSLPDRSSVSHLKKALSDPEPRVREAALAAVATVDDLPKGVPGLVAARLADEDGGVVAQAARTLAKHPCPEALEGAQAAWDAATPQVRTALAAAIQALVDDTTLAPKNAALAAWWKERPTRKPVRVATIPLTGHGVLFVLDVSTYMKPTDKEAPWKTVPPPASKPATPVSSVAAARIGQARHELQMAIRKLPEDARFNVLVFNHGAALWERSMMPGTKKNKDDVFRWLRALKPSGAAYVEGALRLAFRLAGAFAQGGEEVRMPQIDTLVLLSAGTTTNNAFPTHGPVEPAPVLDNVRAWNDGLGLTVHTVCLGGSEFMQSLAAQNGGTYAHTK